MRATRRRLLRKRTFVPEHLNSTILTLHCRRSLDDRGGAGGGRITFADESHDDVFSRISFAASMRLMRLESRLFSFSPS